MASGLHPGAGLCVYRRGVPVLDLCGGTANQGASKPVERDTMFVLYSCTKALAASCLHILWERAKVAWDDPVALHWPEFGQQGKEGVTVRHILTHMGGFPETPPELTWDLWQDWETVVRAMDGARPVYEPGTTLAYHSINYGWVVGELARRIDGRPFSQFLREELTGPLGMDDTYVGLPPSLEGRVSMVHPMEDAGDRAEFVGTFNKPEVHQAAVPGACGIAMARDLARFYAMMEQGGTLDGVTVLRPGTVAEVTRLQVEAHDHTTQKYAYQSLGLQLAEPWMGSSPTAIRTYGHGGAGTSIAWADPDLGLAFAYITNGYRADETNQSRLAAMSQAVRDALPLTRPGHYYGPGPYRGSVSS